MIADSNSNIAWHRVQLKKNRDAVKALETARFAVGEIGEAWPLLHPMSAICSCDSGSVTRT